MQEISEIQREYVKNNIGKKYIDCELLSEDYDGILGDIQVWNMPLRRKDIDNITPYVIVMLSDRSIIYKVSLIDKSFESLTSKFDNSIIDVFYEWFKDEAVERYLYDSWDSHIDNIDIFVDKGIQNGDIREDLLSEGLKDYISDKKKQRKTNQEYEDKHKQIISLEQIRFVRKNKLEHNAFHISEWGKEVLGNEIQVWYYSNELKPIVHLMTEDRSIDISVNVCTWKPIEIETLIVKKAKIDNWEDIKHNKIKTKFWMWLTPRIQTQIYNLVNQDIDIIEYIEKNNINIPKHTLKKWCAEIAKTKCNAVIYRDGNNQVEKVSKA